MTMTLPRRAFLAGLVAAPLAGCEAWSNARILEYQFANATRRQRGALDIAEDQLTQMAAAPGVSPELAARLRAQAAVVGQQTALLSAYVNALVNESQGGSFDSPVNYEELRDGIDTALSVAADLLIEAGDLRLLRYRQSQESGAYVNWVDAFWDFSSP